MAEMIGSIQSMPPLTEDTSTVDLQNTPLVTVLVENPKKSPAIGVIAAIIAASVLATLVISCILLVLLAIACKTKKRKKENGFHPNATFYIGK
jgi:hypothetical protein